MYAIIITRNNTVLYVYKARSKKAAIEEVAFQTKVEARISDGEADIDGTHGYVFVDGEILKEIRAHRMMASDAK